MGTNYYVMVDVCKHCNRGERIHLGKSSCGWKFAVDMNEEYYKTFDEFLNFISREDIEITNEYGEEINYKDLMNTMESACDMKSHFDEYPRDKYADCRIVDLHKGGFS